MKKYIRSITTGKCLSIIGFIILIIILGAYLHANFSKKYDLILKEKSKKISLEKKLTKTITTTFIDLNVLPIKVPVNRKGRGGALTSFNAEVLLITHEGGIFLVSDDEIKKTKIESPENGFEDYKKAAKSEKYKNYNFKFKWFRYNDILYYKEGSEQGLVVSYHEWNADKECYSTTIAKLILPLSIDSILEFQASRSDWKIVYRTQPCLKLKSVWRAMEGHISGGRIDYLKNGKIILGNGDYHWDGLYAPVALSQLPDNDYGKILVIDLNKSTSQTITIGNRNTQGVLVAADGQIWTTEHGPRGGDELNRIIAGKNYGWPKETLGTRYNKLPWPSTISYGRHDTYTAPIYAWVPSFGISGLTQIKNFHPSWDGDLLASSLRGKTLFRLRIKENRVIFAEPIDIGVRIRYVHQHTDGRIILWTDSKFVLYLTPSPLSSTAVFMEETIDKANYNSELKKKIKTAFNSCIECHSFDAIDNINSPALGDIYGKEIASTRYSGYSESLQSLTGVWTADELAKFLGNPNEYAPGTSMPDPGIDDPDVIKGIIDVLRKLKTADG